MNQRDKPIALSPSYPDIALYSLVRICALIDPSINRDGWGFNKRTPVVGETGVLIDILKTDGWSDHYIVENSDPSDGTTIWLSDFLREELEPLSTGSR